MEIKSIQRALDLQAGHMRGVTYTTVVDEKGNQYVRQVVEQVVLYSKFPLAGNGKGLYVDVTV
jgi:hypothetical protein